MANASSHDFDPITSEDIEGFKEGLEFDYLVEVLKVDIAQRAISDFMEVLGEVAKTKAGEANPQDVAAVAEHLGGTKEGLSSTEIVEMLKRSDGLTG